MEYGNKFICKEPAEGDVPADAIATAIIKISCILVIGVAILTSVVSTSNITSNSVFFAMYNSVIGNINSGYTLAALMVLAAGSGAILHFLGFV